MSAIYKCLVREAPSIAGIAAVCVVIYKFGENHAYRLEGHWTSEDVREGIHEYKRAYLRLIGVSQAVDKVKVKLFGSSDE